MNVPRNAPLALALLAALVTGAGGCAAPCPSAPPAVPPPAAPAPTAGPEHPNPRPSESAGGNSGAGRHAGGHHASEGHHGHGGGPSGPLVHRFQDAEKWAKRFEGPERDAWQKPAALVKALALAPGMHVADVGAGTGYLLPHLSPAVGDTGRVYAVDIEPTMVSHMLQRVEGEGLSNVVPQLGTVNDPMLPPASLDRVVFVDVWHHVPERAAYAGRVAASLKKGGKLVVVDFELDSERGPKRHHKLAPEKVVADLEEAGLSVVVDTDTLPEQYIVVGTQD